MAWSSGGLQHSNGAGNLVFAQHPNAQIMAAKGNKVVSGCAVTEDATPDLTVDVAAGTVIANGIVVAVSASDPFSGTPVTFATSQGALTSGQAQFVMVHVDSSGVITNTEGTAAAAGQQLPPDIPEDEAILAMITLTEGDSTIDTVDIEDWRQFTPDGIVVGDNKKIMVGDLGDLQIYHDSTNSNIVNTFGGLEIKNNVGDIGFWTTGNILVRDLDASNAILFQLDTTARTLVISSPSGSAMKMGIGVTPTELFTLSGAVTDRILFDNTGAGATSVAQTHGGMLLTHSSGGASGEIYTPGYLFGSTDASLTTTNPKFLAGIVAFSTETYNVDTRSGMGIEFFTTPNTAGATPTPSSRMIIDEDGNVGIGVTPLSKLHIQQTALTTSLPTFRGVIIIDSDTGDVGEVGGIEFNIASANSGFGWRITGSDQGAGNTPLLFQYRSNSATWTDAVIMEDGNVTINGALIINNDATSADIEAQLKLGSANAVKTRPSIFVVGNGTLGEGFLPQNITNDGAADMTISCTVELPCDRGGLSLRISEIGLFLSDADAGDFVDSIFMIGLVDGVDTTLLNVSGLAWNTTGVQSHDPADIDCTGFTTVEFLIGCSNTNANDLDIRDIWVEYYYA